MEAQETFAFALVEENKAGMDLAKKILGDETTTIYVGTANTTSAVTYKAESVFKETEHVVSYPVMGSDLNQLMIGLGQRIGLGTMSKETAQQLDPFIDNPEQERDRVVAEGLEQALLQSMQNQAAQGAIPPLVLSKIMTLVRNDQLELADAFAQVTEEAAKKAQQEQQVAEEATADDLAAEATVKAMAGPEAASRIQGGNATQQSLGGMLNMLSKGARQPRARV